MTRYTILESDGRPSGRVVHDSLLVDGKVIDDYVDPGQTYTTTDCDPSLIDPLYTGGVWTEAADAQTVADDLTTYKVQAELDMDAAEEVYRDQLMGPVSGHRSLEYTAALMEAYGVVSEIDVPTVGNGKRKIIDDTTADEANLVIGIYDSIGPIYNATRHIRHDGKAAIDAATDKAGVDAALAQYHTDIQAFIATLP